MLPDICKDTAYFIGVGLGNSSGQPAILVLKRANWETGERSRYDYSRRLVSRFEVCRWDRFAPDALHGVIAARAAEISREAGVSGRATFVVDTTGDGGTFVRKLHLQNIGECRVLSVAVTGPDAEMHQNNTYYLPRRGLLSGLLTTMDKCQFTFPGAVYGIEELQAELARMQAAWRSGGLPALDRTNPSDTVIAMAMAVWRAKKFEFYE
ncbi:MAG: hypothetical protein JST93_17660 [Acidobacteria bacterium]|nr:hypothetical protein [Acidobacteriota bacterium]